MHRLLFFFLFVPIVHLFPWTLLDVLSEKGRDGDTVILQYGSIVYGIRFHRDPPSLNTLFIAKAPLQLKEREQFPSWIEWMDRSAKGALETLVCPVKQLQKDSAELHTFFSLEWTRQSEAERKKRGAPPLSGEFDFRPLWHPKIVVDGISLQECISDAYETVWPDDGSELAQRALVSYFPRTEKAVPWFPYWIELAGGKQALFVLDSKKGPSNNEQSR